MTQRLPPDFEKRIHGQLGDEADALLHAITECQPPVSIRLNPAKTGGEVPESVRSLVSGQVPWCPDGLYLAQRPTFTLDPCFQGGSYYVQEASSMFVGYAVRQIAEKRPLRVLDLCGAPGGKSTHLLACLPEESLLVANEAIRSRAAILKENITRWGYPNAVVTNNDPSDFSALEGAFDILVIDAPCSGEGMFRKDPSSIDEWSVGNLDMCSARQRRILTDSWKSLKPGGFLIYSTCTYNPGENEEMLAWTGRELGAESVEIPLPDNRIVTGNERTPGYHFYPHRTVGEGFFCGILRKNDGTPGREKSGKRPKQTASPLPPEVMRMLVNGSFSAIREENRISVVPAPHADFTSRLRTKLHVLQCGCEAVELFNQKIKPLHALAVSTLLNHAAVERCELSPADAVKYLKREEIRVSSSTGAWTLATCDGIALGWGKNLGNRFNNYFPKELRIRMETPKN